MRMRNRLAYGGSMTGITAFEQGTNTSMLNISGFSGGGSNKSIQKRSPRENHDLSMTQQVAHFD